MNMTSDLRLVAEFRKRAELALPGRVAKVVLFGSRARGEARPDSDWDVAVFLSGSFKAEDQWTLSDTAFDLMIELDHAYFIQPIAFRAERESEDTQLMRHIREEGRLV